MKVNSNLVGNGAMRITIPKKIRDELCLVPGDTFEMKVFGKIIVIKKLVTNIEESP